MRLDEDECRRRLTAADHGVLGTVHPERAVDAVPVVFAALGDGRLVVPVDTVKPKSGGRLQRLANLELDPRCVLLVERYDDDWSQLWWVRVHATAAEVEPAAPLVEALADRHEQYRRPGSVTSAIVLTPTETTGWSAA